VIGKALKGGVGKVLEFGVSHPRIAIGGAALAGVSTALKKDARDPYVQETFLGAPNALSTITSGYTTAALRGYTGGDMASQQYAYGRNIAGADLDQIAGARIFGGYNLSPSAQRIRGSGRDAGRTDGSIVFGMYNTR
jgi:hypothetical protein